MSELIASYTRQLHPYVLEYALPLAKRVHAKNPRPDYGNGSEPYENHLIRVAHGAQIIAEDFLARFGLPPHITDLPKGNTIQNEHNAFLAAVDAVSLLHDAYEDYPEEISLEELSRHLPTSVVAAIRVISKPSKAKQEKVGWYLRYVQRVLGDPIARIVKLADLQDNMSDLRRGSLRDKYEVTAHILSFSNGSR